MPKISADGASGGGQLPVPADAFIREDGVITAPPGGGGGSSFNPAVTTIASASGTVDLAAEDSNAFDVTLTGNTTFAFTGTFESGTEYSFTLYLYENSTGGYTVTWPGSVSWIGGTAPTLSTAASDLNVLVFSTVDGGSAWIGSVVSAAPSLPLSAANGGSGVATAPANEVFAGPASGSAAAPGFRALVAADVPYKPWQFHVGSYGAKGNTITVYDGAITNGTNTLACHTTTPFTSTAVDGGKTVEIPGAGASGTDLVTTITSITDSGDAVLAADAGTTVSGAQVSFGTDDTAAINSAMAAGYAYALANNSYYELIFDPLTYMLAGATSTGSLGTTGQCKAQLPLPVTATTAQKVIHVWRGTRDQTPMYHWQQTKALQAGAVLKTVLDANSEFGSTGTEPSVAGGPLPANGYGSGTSLFGNDLFVVDGIAIQTPENPQICGFDFRGCAEANVISAQVMVNASGGLIDAVAAPTNTLQFALGMPETNNNDNANILKFSTEGQNYGLIASEHTVIWSMRAAYCVAGLVCSGQGGSSTPHSMLVTYASVEACVIAVQLAYSTASPTKLRILMLDYESGTGNWANYYIINDPDDNGVGDITVNNIGAATPRTSTFSAANDTLNGGTGLRVFSSDLPRGHITAPSVPSTTTALLNGSGADAAVTVTGGTVTVITVDGTATGLTSGLVIVPANKTIAITYSGAPSWDWVLFG